MLVRDSKEHTVVIISWATSVNTGGANICVLKVSTVQDTFKKRKKYINTCGRDSGSNESQQNFLQVGGGGEGGKPKKCPP